MNLFKINPIIPLAINLADRRRRFILFCGAGVSKDAGIPSSQDIRFDTLGKIYQQEQKKGKFSKKEVEEWCLQNKTLKSMTYSDILDLAYPGMEQKRLYLNSFFEGKQPGETHKAIAKMISTGLIRFIITTNFDNFIEKALDSEGLGDKYSVISTNDQAKNSDTWDKIEVCRIYKIHGDKDQGIIRNSPKELEKLDKYIEKDFQELINRHGVIVLGYAGEDEGAMRCFKKREYHRYSIYWQYCENVNAKVKNMILNQDGVLIQRHKASEFLNELLERIEIIYRTSETETTETIKKGYEQILIRGNPLEIKARIEEERSHYVEKIRSAYESVGQNPDGKHIWDVHIELIEKASRNIILGDQLLRFETSRDWEEFIKIFEEIHSIDKDQNGYGRNELINYLFFSLFLVVGSRALKYERFAEIKRLFSIRKLYRDRMDYILDWNIQASYLKQKNQNEPQRFYVPQMHYLLGLADANKFPIDKDELRKLILEFDLLCFIYTTKNLKVSRWRPGCVYYFKHESPQFLQKIKIDDEYCEKIAGHLFNETKDVLRTSLTKVNDMYESFSSQMEGWPENPFKAILTD
ncbi:SIR2 family protein [Patescibacteria group bacterium]|nr:SIR2 family protein [Patescibacteria group bacterium]